MRDRQPVDPTALAAQPISDRAHRIVGTRDHHRSRTIDRRDAHIVPQHRRYLVFTGLHRKHGAAGGHACINRPRAATSIAASGKHSAPATCAAANSPTE